MELAQILLWLAHGRIARDLLVDARRICSIDSEDSSIMFQKLFRKPSDIRPKFHPDPTLAEALARRLDAIEFQPSRGFLKDQWQTRLRPASETQPNA